MICRKILVRIWDLMRYNGIDNRNDILIHILWCDPSLEKTARQQMSRDFIYVFVDMRSLFIMDLDIRK